MEESESRVVRSRTSFESDSRVKRTQAKVDQIADIMHENIFEMNKRGECLDNIHDKSDDVKEKADMFKKKSKKAKRESSCLYITFVPNRRNPCNIL